VTKIGADYGLTKMITGWTFREDARDLENRDWVKRDCELELYVRGFQGAKRAFDALESTDAGPWVAYCEFGGRFTIGTRTFCSTERRALWHCDASRALRAYACRVALDVIGLWRASESVHRALSACTPDHVAEKQAFEAHKQEPKLAAREAAMAAAIALETTHDKGRGLARGAVFASYWSRMATRRTGRADPADRQRGLLEEFLFDAGASASASANRRAS
jgi:hypothetical protein